jgi:hypothetical protein
MSHRAAGSRWCAVAAVLFVALSWAGTATAQSGRSLRIDPSIRSAGMASASTAVGWGDANFWSNPALIGAGPGVRYERSRTALIPELADDVTFENRQWVASVAGIGVMSAGEPFGATGGREINFGTQEGSDPMGNPTGTFESWDRAQTYGAGVRILELVDHVSGVSGTEAGLRRLGDIAIGWAHQDVEVLLAPGYGARAESQDFGILIKGPYWRREPATRDHGALGLEVAYGASILSAGDGSFTFINSASTSPLARQQRHGIAARGAVSLSENRRTAWRQSIGLLAEGLEPLVAVVLAFDHARVTYRGSPSFDHSTNALGLEVIVLGVATVRAGRYSDPRGDITDFSYGFGLGLPIGRVAGVRYDYASFPVASDSGLSDHHRHGWAAFIDPVELVRSRQR